MWCHKHHAVHQNKLPKNMMYGSNTNSVGQWLFIYIIIWLLLFFTTVFKRRFEDAKHNVSGDKKQSSSFFCCDSFIHAAILFFNKTPKSCLNAIVVSVFLSTNTNERNHFCFCVVSGWQVNFNLNRQWSSRSTN